MNSEQIIIIAVVIINAGIDTLLVLGLNPKMAAKRIERTILNDKAFVSAMVKSIFDIVNADPQMADPVINRIQQKLIGTLNGAENAFENPAERKSMAKIVNSEIIEMSPELNALLEYFPKAKVAIGKNPQALKWFIESLMPYAKEYLREKGFIS